MTTQQQIEDPGQWRVGDDVSVTFEDGATLTGKLRERFNGGEMWVGDRAVRYLNGESIQAYTSATVTVTRTVEPIPEPTEWLSGVKFADGTKAARFFAGESAWGESGTSSWVNFTWQELLGQHGAPVAVSLPHWSDEAHGPGLLGQVAALETLYNAEDGSREKDSAYDRLRALLAEGGEA